MTCFHIINAIYNLYSHTLQCKKTKTFVKFKPSSNNSLTFNKTEDQKIKTAEEKLWTPYYLVIHRLRNNQKNRLNKINLKNKAIKAINSFLQKAIFAKKLPNLNPISAILDKLKHQLNCKINPTKKYPMKSKIVWVSWSSILISNYVNNFEEFNKTKLKICEDKIDKSKGGSMKFFTAILIHSKRLN